jgi:hypothetical protein
MGCADVTVRHPGSRAVGRLLVDVVSFEGLYVGNGYRCDAKIIELTQGLTHYLRRAELRVVINGKDHVTSC